MAAPACVDDKTGLVSLERALSIRILDSEERELTVDRAAEVVALMPAARADAPFSERTYSFDEALGEWIEEGRASQLTRDGVRAYYVSIEHLSWWAVGKLHAATTCVRACVEDADGARVDGAQVWIVGASHAGVSTFFTDDSGCGASDVIAEASVTLVAEYLGAVSAPSKVSTGKSGFSIGKDPGKCRDGGTLVLETESANKCPSGFSLCDQACVDLTSDARHCGGCGDACGAGELCAAAVCEAPAANTIAVRGKVVDRYGSPWAGTTVQIGSEVHVTDAGGAFAFDDVVIPYDLKVVRPSGPQLYLGLTRADPEVRDDIGSGNTGTVNGVVSGDGIPLLADHELNVSFVAPTATGYNFIRRAGQGGSWGPAVLRWSPAMPVLEGMVFAIQHDEISGAVTGMGSRDFSLENGGSLSSPTTDIVLAPVTPHAVDFEVNVPAGMTFVNYDLGLGLYSQILSSPPSTKFSLDVPDELPDDVPARFIARGRTGTGDVSAVHYFGADVRSVEVDLPLPVACVAPADGAMVPRTASLEFKPQAGSVTALDIDWLEASDRVYAVAYTQDSSVSFARMSALGITPAPDDGTLSWAPSGSGPSGDVDELLAPGRAPFPDTVTSGTAGRTLTLEP